MVEPPREVEKELGFCLEEKPSFVCEIALLGAGGFVTCVVIPQVKPAR